MAAVLTCDVCGAEIRTGYYTVGLVVDGEEAVEPVCVCWRQVCGRKAFKLAEVRRYQSMPTMWERFDARERMVEVKWPHVVAKRKDRSVF